MTDRRRSARAGRCDCCGDPSERVLCDRCHDSVRRVRRMSPKEQREMGERIALEFARWQVAVASER